MPRSRNLRAKCRSCQGADSRTRKVRANGVRSARSADRNAISGSICQAPSRRASSATSPARVTAGLGSSRNAPGVATGTSAPGPPGPLPERSPPGPPGSPEAAAVPGPPDLVAARSGPGVPDGAASVSPDGRTVARLRAVASAGDHSMASFKSRSTATNSASQPAGTRLRGSPGAALMPTAGTTRARSRHQPSGGWLCPVARRRPPERRAGSTNTASTPARATPVTSAHTADSPSAAP
jgi:hypothetical protein